MKIKEMRLSVRMYLNRKELATFEREGKSGEARKPNSSKIRALSPEPGAVEPEPAGKWIGGRRHARGGDKLRAGANCQSGDRQRNGEGSEHCVRGLSPEISRQAIAKVSAATSEPENAWMRRAASTQTARISLSSTAGELIITDALGMCNTRFRVRGSKEVGFPEGEPSSGNPD